MLLLWISVLLQQIMSFLCVKVACLCFTLASSDENFASVANARNTLRGMPRVEVEENGKVWLELMERIPFIYLQRKAVLYDELVYGVFRYQHPPIALSSEYTPLSYNRHIPTKASPPEYLPLSLSRSLLGFVG